MAKEVVFLTPPLGMAGTSGQFSTDPSQPVLLGHLGSPVWKHFGNHKMEQRLSSK